RISDVKFEREAQRRCRVGDPTCREQGRSSGRQTGGPNTRNEFGELYLRCEKQFTGLFFSLAMPGCAIAPGKPGWRKRRSLRREKRFSPRGGWLEAGEEKFTGLFFGSLFNRRTPKLALGAPSK